MTAPQLPHDVGAMPTADGGAPVVVTIESMYRLLLEVRDGVRDSAHLLSAAADDVADHEERIRSLERKVWIAAGLAMAGGAGLSQVLSGG